MKSTLMFLSTSPLQREMRGTVKDFHAGSKVFFMTWSQTQRHLIMKLYSSRQKYDAVAATAEQYKCGAVSFAAHHLPPDLTVK